MIFTDGTTSACAENTGPQRHRPPTPWNYLRVRGEYVFPLSLVTDQWELPPRARRIPPSEVVQVIRVGTTSACAENTLVYTLRSGVSRNYLRVRGEYLPPVLLFYHTWELPPRARRIPSSSSHRIRLYGTTSACAENTDCCRCDDLRDRNYLRVRGEYSMPPLARASIAELPPRARRILRQWVTPPSFGGTTSACAENTPERRKPFLPAGNYLRVRGEYPK